MVAGILIMSIVTGTVSAAGALILSHTFGGVMLAYMFGGIAGLLMGSVLVAFQSVGGRRTAALLAPSALPSQR